MGPARWVSRDFLLVAVLCASVVSFVSIPLFGHISDQIGERKMYMLGAATVGVFGFIYFEMLNTRSLLPGTPGNRALPDPSRHDVSAARPR